MSTNEQAQSEPVQDQFYADTGYDWTDPAGDDVRKVWLAGRASALALPLSAEPVTGPSEATVKRLQDAIEGECDGLAVNAHVARDILRYVGGLIPVQSCCGRRECGGECGNDGGTEWVADPSFAISPPVAAPADGLASDARAESHYVSGLKMGWNMGLAGLEDEFNKTLNRFTESAAMLRKEARAAAAPTPAAATTTGEAAAPDAQPVSDNGAVGRGPMAQQVDALLTKMAAAGLPEAPSARLEGSDLFAEQQALQNPAPSQAHSKSGAVAYPELPPANHFERVYGGHGNELVYAYYDEAQMRTYVDADRAQRPAAPQPAPAHPDARDAMLREADIIKACEAAGMKWCEPDGDEDGFPGAFDMPDMASMQRLFASLGKTVAVPCDACFGKGVEGDADDYGQTISVECGSCKGKAIITLPPVAGVPIDDRYRQKCTDGFWCRQGCLKNERCYHERRAALQAEKGGE